MKQTKNVLMKYGIAIFFMLSACTSTSIVPGDSADSVEIDQTSSNHADLRLMEQTELGTMDPAKSVHTVSFNALINTMEGLYRYDSNKELELGMASKKPRISEDGLEYQFSIREDAQWSNGSPVTADDFVYAWQRMVSPETDASYSYLFEGVILNATEIVEGSLTPDALGVEALDEKTLLIQLEKITPHFESLLTLPAFLPLNEEYVNEKGTEFGRNSESTLYNGPFTLTNWDGIATDWQFEKNEQYWDKNKVELEKISIEIIKESTTAYKKFQNDQIDRVHISGDTLQDIGLHKNLKREPTSAVMYLKFNQERDGSPTVLANHSIRKAIAVAINKRQFVSSVLQNEATPVNGLIPEDLNNNPATDEDFRAENGSQVTHDVREARSLFQMGLKELKTDSISLEIVGDDTETAIDSLVHLQQSLMRTLPGLNITIKTVSFSERMKIDSAEEYDLQLAGWGADYADPMTFLEIWESSNPNNHSNYSDEKFDDLIYQAENTVDMQERWNLMLEAEKELMNDAAVAPIYQPVTIILEKDSVQDIVTLTNGLTISLKWAKKVDEIP